MVYGDIKMTLVRFWRNEFGQHGSKLTFVLFVEQLQPATAAAAAAAEAAASGWQIPWEIPNQKLEAL